MKKQMNALDEAIADAFDELIAELRLVRSAGAGRVRDLRLPSISAMAEQHFSSTSPSDIQSLLRLAVEDLGPGLSEEAEYILGLKSGTSAWPLAARRSRAAELRGIQPDTYRKQPETRLLALVAESAIKIMAPSRVSSPTHSSDLSSNPMRAAQPYKNVMKGTFSTAIQARDIATVNLVIDRMAPIRSNGLPLQPKLLCREAELAGWEAENNNDERSRLTLVGGAPGSGSSALAVEIARRLGATASGGQIYVDLRLEAGALASLRATLEILGIRPTSLPSTLSGAISMYRSLTSDRPATILFDNIPNDLDVSLLIPSPPTQAVLVVSEDSIESLAGFEHISVAVHPLAREDSLRMLTEILGPTKSPELSSLDRIANICGDRAGDLAVVGRGLLVRGGSIGLTAMGDRPMEVLSFLPISLQTVLKEVQNLPIPSFGAEELAVANQVTLASAESRLKLLLDLGLVHRISDFSYRLDSVVGRHWVLDATLQNTLADRLRPSIIHRLRDALMSSDISDRDFALTESGLETGPASGTHGLSAYCETAVALADYFLRSNRFEDAFSLVILTKPYYIQTLDFLNWGKAAAIGLAAAAQAHEDRTASLAEAHTYRGHWAMRAGDDSAAASHFKRARRLSIGAALTTVERESINAQGLMAMNQSRFDRATVHFRRALKLSAGDPRWSALVRCNMVECRLRSGARSGLIEELLSLKHAFEDDPPSMGNLYWLLAWAYRRQEDFTLADKWIRRAIAIAKRLDVKAWEAFWSVERSRISLLSGDLRKSRIFDERAIELERAAGNMGREADALLHRCLIEASDGQIAKVAHLLEQVGALLNASGDEPRLQMLAVVRDAVGSGTKRTPTAAGKVSTPSQVLLVNDSKVLRSPLDLVRAM